MSPLRPDSSSEQKHKSHFKPILTITAITPPSVRPSDNTNGRAPTAPMTPPPASAGGLSSSHSTELVVLEGVQNLAAWEKQLATIATGLGASQYLISAPDQPVSSLGASDTLCPLGKSPSSVIDALIARYKQVGAENSLHNAMAKTISPQIYAWMLALGLSPSASIPANIQYAYARLAALRFDSGTQKMKSEDVARFKMLVDRIEGLERDAIKKACVSEEYFYIVEANISKILRNRITCGDSATEAWLMGRSHATKREPVDGLHETASSTLRISDDAGGPSTPQGSLARQGELDRDGYYRGGDSRTASSRKRAASPLESDHARRARH